MNQLVADAPYTEDKPVAEEFELDVGQGLVTIDHATGEIDPEEEMPEDNEENRAVLRRIEQRKINLANEWWNLAADLYEVQAKKLYRLAGFAKIDDYFKANIDSTPRYGYELTNIHECFAIDLPNKLADRPDEYDEVIRKIKLIGVTKTKEIARGKIKDPEVLVDIVNQTFEPNDNGYMKTVDEVKSMITNYKHGLKGDPASVEFDKKSKDRDERAEQNKKETFKFKLPFGQAEKVNEALNSLISRHEMDDNDKSRSLAFFRICEEWSIESHASTEGVRPGVEYELKRMEEIYGVKIVAFKADEKGFIKLNVEEGVPSAEILYGEDTFNDLVSSGDDSPAEAVEA